MQIQHQVTTANVAGELFFVDHEGRVNELGCFESRSDALQSALQAGYPERALCDFYEMERMCFPFLFQ